MDMLEHSPTADEDMDMASDDDGQDNDDDADLAYQFDPEFGYPTEETDDQAGQLLHRVVVLNLWALQLEVDLETVIHHLVYGGEAYGDGGALVVPASDAAVAGLEKQAFNATSSEGCEGGCGVARCAICLEEFEDGEEVTVMPCSGGHEFHPGCITEWLRLRNTCPLCRHALPTDVTDGGPYDS